MIISSSLHVPTFWLSVWVITKLSCVGKSYFAISSHENWIKRDNHYHLLNICISHYFCQHSSTEIFPLIAECEPSSLFTCQNSLWLGSRLSCSLKILNENHLVLFNLTYCHIVNVCFCILWPSPAIMVASVVPQPNIVTLAKFLSMCVNFSRSPQCVLSMCVNFSPVQPNGMPELRDRGLLAPWIWPAWALVSYPSR